jgi:hypothetical protein
MTISEIKNDLNKKYNVNLVQKNIKLNTFIVNLYERSLEIHQNYFKKL